MKRLWCTLFHRRRHAIMHRISPTQAHWCCGRCDRDWVEGNLPGGAIIIGNGIIVRYEQ